MTEALSLNKLRFAYGRQDLFDAFCLGIRPGEFVGIIGPNGSGKSTLVKLMARFIRPTSGEVLLDGRDISTIPRREIARSLAVVPQEFSFYFPYKVWDFVMMGRHPYQGFAALQSEDDRSIVQWAMAETGTEAFAERSVLELSGGEKQRVILASALAQDTDILLLDEPTSALDMHYQVAIYGVLKRLNRQKQLTVVAVTHDLNLGAQFCDRLILLDEGRIRADGPPEEIITPALIQRTFRVSVEGGRTAATGKPYVIPLGEGGE